MKITIPLSLSKKKEKHPAEHQGPGGQALLHQVAKSKELQEEREAA